MKAISISPLLLLLSLLVNPVHGDWPLHIIDGSSQGADGAKLADFDGDGRLDIATGWEEGGLARVYLHPGPKQVKKAWPRFELGKTPSAEDAFFVNLDDDQDLEVVVLCEGKERSVILADPVQGGKDWKQKKVLKKKMSFLFGWPSPYKEKELVLGGKGKRASIGIFRPADEHWQKIHPVGWLMAMEFVDMDGDQDLDIVYTDRRGKHQGFNWLEYDPNHKGAWKLRTIALKGEEVMDFVSDGSGGFFVAVVNKGIAHVKEGETQFLPLPPGVGKMIRGVACSDLNGDGQMDVVVSTDKSEGLHGCFAQLQQKDGNWSFHPISGTEMGIKFDRLELLDIDQDGDLDLLTCEERHEGKGLGVLWFENPGVFK